MNVRYHAPVTGLRDIEEFLPFATRFTEAKNGSETVTVTFRGSYTSAGEGVATKFEREGGVVSRTVNVPCEDRFQFPLGSTASTVKR